LIVHSEFCFLSNIFINGITENDFWSGCCEFYTGSFEIRHRPVSITLQLSSANVCLAETSLQLTLRYDEGESDEPKKRKHTALDFPKSSKVKENCFNKNKRLLEACK
jgi:hypothetical protein